MTSVLFTTNTYDTGAIIDTCICFYIVSSDVMPLTGHRLYV